MSGPESTHAGELQLRRLLVGELVGPPREALDLHLAACERCRGKVAAFEEEQRAFEAALPFERFAAGVEQRARALEAEGAQVRSAPAKAARAWSRRPWLASAVALAAGVLVTVAVLPQLDLPHAPNRLKGGASITLRIAGPGEGAPQRDANETGEEALSPGERVRIGVQPGGYRYLTSISIDEAGEATALYPETGASVPLSPTPSQQYLPGALEFTGRGREKVIVILSAQPVEVGVVAAAAREAYERAGGDLGRLGTLQLPVEAAQVQRTLVKP